MSEAENPRSREKRLQSLIASYLQAVEAGRSPNREELLAQYPDLADSLASFFGGHDRMRQRADELLRPEMSPMVDPAEVRTLAPGELPVSTPRHIRYFGDYELVQEIARGGMGVVYKARQASLNRTVALKMILAGQSASPEEVQRFRREAEAAANLDHPNIVPIYEVGAHDGQNYFSMKLVEGGSLAGSALPFPERQAAALLARVARAIHHAHQRGIIHRDLKPANILLDSSGQPHVTDFGLAKHVVGGAQGTRTGNIVGTPSYMAPEQARAEKVLTTSVDVYSLGAILYELLTGRPPFRAATPLDTVLQVLDREPDPPRTLRPQLNRDLETICLRCLEKEVAKRYGSAELLAEDLERWGRGEPIVARRVGTVERTWKWVKRRPLAAAFGATAASLVTLVALGGPVVAIREAKLRHTAEESAQKAIEASGREIRAQRDKEAAQEQVQLTEGQRDEKSLEAMQTSVQANLRRTQAIRAGTLKGKPSEAIQVLRDTADLRRSMNDLAARLGTEAVKTNEKFWMAALPRLNDEATAWLTESTLAVDHTVRLSVPHIDVDNPNVPPGGDMQTIGPGNRNVRQFVAPRSYELSKDGSMLARLLGPDAQSRYEIQLIDMTTGTVQATTRLAPTPVQQAPAASLIGVALAFDDHGRLLVAYHEFGEMVKGDPPNKPAFGAYKPYYRKQTLVIETLAVPGGERLRRVTADLVTLLPPPSTFGIQYPPPGPAAAALTDPAIAFSNDRRRLTIYQPRRREFFVPDDRPIPAVSLNVGDGSPVHVVREARGEPVSLPSDRRPGFEPLLSSPAGDKIVGYRKDPPFGPLGAAPDLEILDLTTGRREHRFNIRSTLATAGSIAFSPDGCWLAIVPNDRFEIVLHELAKGLTRRAPLRASGKLSLAAQVAFSSDGSSLAVATAKHLQIFTVPDLKEMVWKVYGENPANAPDVVGLEDIWRVPTGLRFLSPRRFALGFQPIRLAPLGGGDSTTDEVWEFWEFSPSTAPAPVTIQGSACSATFVSKKSIVALAGNVVRAVDFDRQELRLIQRGLGANEVSMPPLSLWEHHPLSGPRWKDQDDVPWTSPEEFNDFDSSGNCFVHYQPGKNQSPSSIEIWDVAKGICRRIMPNAEVLTRTRDRRLLAFRAWQATSQQTEIARVARIVALAAGNMPSLAMNMIGRSARSQPPIDVLDLAADRVVCRFGPDLWANSYGTVFTPDGRFLIGTGIDGTILIGRIADGATLGPVKGGLHGNGKLSISPCGNRLMLLAEDRAECHGRLVELQTGRVLHEFKMGNRRRDELPVAFSPDGSFVAVVAAKAPAFDSKEVLLWSAADGELPVLPLPVNQNAYETVQLEFSPDGHQLLISSVIKDAADNSAGRINGWRILELWNLVPRRRIASSQSSAGSLTGFRVSAGGKAAALWFQPGLSEGRNLRTELWDLPTGKLRKDFTGRAVKAASPDGRYLVLSTDDLNTQLIDTRSGESILGLGGPGPALFSEDSRIMRFGDDHGNTVLYHLGDRPGVELPIKINRPQWLSADNSLLLSEDAATGLLRAWDTKTGRENLTLVPRDTHTLPGMSCGDGCAVRICPGNRTLAVNVHGQLRLFDLRTGKFTMAFNRSAHAAPVAAVATSPGGRWIASASADRTVGVWHAGTGRFAAILDGFAAAVRSVAFTPGGRTLVARDDSGHLAAWRLEEPADAGGQPEIKFAFQRDAPRPGASDASLAIRPDGRQCALANADGTVTLLRMADGSSE
jgi:WD40 repeat protein